ncbi:hypothetical protein E2C01_021174 [Portunus trituberculatus]|uniref:Uncharacterized protein n=1 Tax=Portunus trituberculatus TaxID=210409 RepID=A0A5B7E1X8_PORTR|nr:hypothetical protein [Portunus trituberculatus]
MAAAAAPAETRQTRKEPPSPALAKSGCGRPAFAGGLVALGHAANTGASCCGTEKWRGRFGSGGVGRVGAG